jgi:hypothetical protein
MASRRIWVSAWSSVMTSTMFGGPLRLLGSGRFDPEEPSAAAETDPAANAQTPNVTATNALDVMKPS